MGARVPPDARILCWPVEFAAYLMNRCDIDSDGKTPLQRLHRRRDNTPILELGERILYMPAKPARGGKWKPRFHPGVFVGMLNPRSSGCHRAGTGDQDKVGEHQESASRRDGTRAEYSRCEPLPGPQWQRQCVRHPSWNGETR